MKTRHDYSLLAHNTFHFDVRCKLFVEYETEDELKQLIDEGTYFQGPWLHIGCGSNLLFRADYPGTILHSAIKGMELIDEKETNVLVRVGAGELFDDFIARCVSRHWYGAENLSLIPGEVGSSAVQNIGAYGAEVKDIVHTVEAIDVENHDSRVFSREECGYAYRSSRFKREWAGRYIITHVTFHLSKRPILNLDYGNVRDELNRQQLDSTIENVRNVIMNIRREKLPDPDVTGNAGSFFMNPVIGRQRFELLHEAYPDMPYYDVDEDNVKVPAAWMIDRCGWKGQRLGNAGVHNKQALILVNCGQATGQEVIALAKEIQYSVFQQFGINMEPEVNFV
ncbi:MAG: UDP-N-acetylmuramate dehydrogenase [Bacteroidales bacterium]|nr:UDP-N-acetylmuramate dehydrogenase [Bacteroidales bacterium]